MTATPQILTETPDFGDDALSDLLDQMRLSGMVLLRGEFCGQWAIGAPDAGQLGNLLSNIGDCLIPFHLVGSGGCWIEAPGGEPIRLSEGDVVLLPGGAAHSLSSHPGLPTEPMLGLLPPPPWPDLPVIPLGAGPLSAGLVCGFLRCDRLLFEPIMRQLPDLLLIRPAQEDHWLQSTVAHTVAQAFDPSPGVRSMLPRLTELMFIEILRKHMQGLSARESGWFAAFSDPVAGGTLRRLHAAPFKPWTVELMAREAGVSRTVLADRFRHCLDLPPMQYLASWRLRLAARRLRETTAPIKLVAGESGYESEAAFSRAFKRHFGLAPAIWRQREAGSRSQGASP